MAYSLFNSSAASNYLASFKPAEPVDGFDDVLSTSATDNITRMQELDYSGRIGLAKQAMVELSSKLQNEALIDYYDRRDDKTMKLEKRKQLANMLGGGGIGGGKSALASSNDFNTRVDNMFTSGDNSAILGTKTTNSVLGSITDAILGGGNKTATEATVKQAPQLQVPSLNLTTQGTDVLSALEKFKK